MILTWKKNQMPMAGSQELSKEKKVLKELGFQPIRMAVRQSIAVVQSGMDGTREILPCKFKRLNRNMLGGWQNGKMYVIAGRPGTGKSAFSNQIIFDTLDIGYNLKRKIIVFYWTFEMPGYQQILRSASKDTGLDVKDLYSLDRTLSEDQFESYRRSVTPYTKYPIYFYNKPKGIQFIIDANRKYMEASPDTTIVNLVDHTRLVPGKEEIELQRLNALSKGLMLLQAEIGCIDIVLSQLNRNIESPERAAKQFQPMLSDLFGGDSIGQDAHVVMMIQRPHDLYGITAKYCGHDPKGLLALHIEKNRDGMLGMIPFDFDGKTFTIKERPIK